MWAGVGFSRFRRQVSTYPPLVHVTIGRVHIFAPPCGRIGRVFTISTALHFWLFAGSQERGSTAAILCSFVVSCQRHQIDPFAFLRDVLARISACPIDDLDQFLPDRWQLDTGQSGPTLAANPRETAKRRHAALTATTLGRASRIADNGSQVPRACHDCRTAET